MDIKLFEILAKQLQKEKGFIGDNKEIKKRVVIHQAQNFDARLIELLLDDKDLKAKFFIEVKGVLVFNQNLFVQFLEQKNYLNDSYTQYKNKVGLTIDETYLKQRNEVALVWPFKDCILEGGQSREADKRDEIFFNEILAQDEITQLLEPKVLTGAKVYNKEGEQDFKKFSRDAKINEKRGLPANTITDNLIIKGNNLLALHSLKKEFVGKIKLIYIDPPYNTGNDGFKYNDNFNHSTWLTFMKNRLTVARELLKDDGVIFVQCDDNEQAYLKVLMDEVFGRENFISNIIWHNNKKGRQMDLHIKSSLEYAIVFSKTSNVIFNNKKIKVNLSTYKKDDIGFYKKGYPLHNGTSDFHIHNRPNLFYTIYYNPKTKDAQVFDEKIYKDKKFNITTSKEGIKLLEKGYYRIIPKYNDTYNNQRVWRWSKEKFLKEYKTEMIFEKEENNTKYKFYIYQKDRVENGTRKQKFTNYIDIDTSYGKKEINDLFPDNKKIFSNSKPASYIKIILDMTTNEGDIVLDYHLGSGTTAAVAHKMGRQYIGVEQMDYIETIAVARLKKVIGRNVKKADKLLSSLEFDTGGISESVAWQGGGAFTYLELKKHNQTFIEQIQKATNSKALLKIWGKMKAKSFLNYNIDLKKHAKHIKEFQQLELSKQKKHLLKLLDKNQLYVNLSAINDQDFGLSEAEKQLTKDFYNTELIIENKKNKTATKLFEQ